MRANGAAATPAYDQTAALLHDLLVGIAIHRARLCSDGGLCDQTRAYNLIGELPCGQARAALYLAAEILTTKFFQHQEHHPQCGRCSSEGSE